ncbi:MAG: hypothetical protein KC636_00380 [Myxococcales bacterium]|nr:hypothetical protein [Myxococcales bacterium]
MSADPSIAAWADFWLATLWIGVALFSALSLYVILGGLFDIRRMFAELRRQADDARAGERE